MKRLWLLISLIVFSIAQAVPISLDCSLYNSDDSLFVSLDGENLGFSGSAIIEPHSMLYQNKGSSNQPDCDYSYSLSLNEKPLASGASTDSGAFSWGAKASSGDYALGSETLSLSARHMVDDGVLSSYFSNSDHEVADEIKADSASYSEALQLDQDSMSSKGKGYTTQPEFSYSFEQMVDGQSLGSGMESDSGAAKWAFSIRPDSLEDESSKTAVSAEGGVEDGYLKSTYFNPNIRVDEDVEVSGATYFQKARIDLEQLDSTGNGVTREEESPSEGDVSDDSDSEENYLDENPANDPSMTNSDAKDIKDSLSISSADKSGSITTSLTGDTRALWHSDVSSNPEEYSFSMLVNGQGTIEDMDEFGMEGEASGLPAQVLPAGTVEISYDYPRDDFQDHLELTEEEIRDFCEDYGLTTPGPSLWYYLQQKSYLYPYEVPIDPDWAALPEDYYRMSMAFTLKNE
jgi:hypothetical protein